MARSTTLPRTEIPTREASDPPDDVDIWQRWTVGIGHGQPRRGADADFRYGFITSFYPEPATSGLPRTTDIIRAARLVRKVPTHKVAALQPAAREQEPRGRHPVERTAMAGWQGQHDQVMYCRRATHRTARIIWQAGTLMRRVTSTPP